jgi:hypothetical protein
MKSLTLKVKVPGAGKQKSCSINMSRYLREPDFASPAKAGVAAVQRQLPNLSSQDEITNYCPIF